MMTFRLTFLAGMFIFILQAISITTAQSIVSTPQIDLGEVCANECNMTIDSSGYTDPPDACRIGHPTDCFKYVVCNPIPDILNLFQVQVMPCPFGTMWRKDNDQLACAQTDLVECPNDPCFKDQYLTVHENNEKNCRMYYKCVDGRSKPACCQLYHRFDPQLNKCVNDSTCDSLCPLLNDETCKGAGVKNRHFQDNNCKTYFDCVNQSPLPVCCADNYGYDIFSSKCVWNESCTDPCPSEYKNACDFSDVTAYYLNDGNCRTYMKCSKTEKGKGETRCCPKGKMFDNKIKQCVEASGACKNAPCPTGYISDINCRFEAVPNKTHLFINLNANGVEMECSPGLHFNQEKCACDYPTVSPTVKPTPGKCEITIHVKLPSLKNGGYLHEKVAIFKIGTKYSPGHDERAVGGMATDWTGSDGINIPYFSTQTLQKFFFEIIFIPKAAPLEKQVLLTTCSNNLKNKLSALEISLMDYQNTTRLLTTSFTTPTTGVKEDIIMPYMLDQPYSYKLLYNGTNFGVILTQLSTPPVSMSDQRLFSGTIYVKPHGLRLHQCRWYKEGSGFWGKVLEFKIAKCLTDQMEAELDAIQPMQPVYPTI